MTLEITGHLHEDDEISELMDREDAWGEEQARRDLEKSREAVEWDA